jgi:short-subunit dehydrogenase
LFSHAFGRREQIVSGGENPLAVVTGASSGIGAAFAESLAARGMDLIVIARRAARLDALAGRLARETGVRVRVIVADLLDSTALCAVEAALRQAPKIDLLVNCAGFGTYGPFTEATPERIKNELTLDLVVPVALTRAALPGMRSRGTGAILNVSSMAGFMPIPKHATYCAAKAGLTRFTEALHGELAGTGVQVLALCPGPVPTEFFAISGYDIEDVPSYMLQSARDCVDSALQALEWRRVVHVPHAFIRIFVRVLALFPLAVRVRILGGGPEWLNGKKAPRRAPAPKDLATP